MSLCFFHFKERKRDRDSVMPPAFEFPYLDETVESEKIEMRLQYVW